MSDKLLETVQRVFPNAVAAGSNLSNEQLSEHFTRADDDLALDLANAERRRDPHASPSLDVWTDKLPEVGGNYVELTLTDFGGGYSEATAIVRPENYRPPCPGRKRSSEFETHRSEMKEWDRERSAQRAKKQVRHRVKSLGADRILTLTSRGYMKTPDDVWLALRTFSRMMKRRMGDSWAYVAVPELHANRQHWHLHLAIYGHLPIKVVRNLWIMALRRAFPSACHDPSPGNPDIDYRQRTHAARLNAISKYISKYITKAIDDGFIHRKRYESTRNISRPKVTKLYCERSLASDFRIIRAVQALSSGSLSRNPSWEVYAGFDCLVFETEPPSI